ncbi:MAG: PadR family transcriptional regulator [Candidatus Cloacimonetes bacterium]|nr:PadR family transcriptional regulator [Candidatus Cloacimonadota bacterium]
MSKNVEKTLSIWEKEYKKGLTAYMILLMLSKGMKYGYEIKQNLIELTEERITFNESSIYQMLKHMESKGFISSEWVEAEKGPKRKYYKVLPAGNQLVKIFGENYVEPMQKALIAMMNGGGLNDKI